QTVVPQLGIAFEKCRVIQWELHFAAHREQCRWEQRAECLQMRDEPASRPTVTKKAQASESWANPSKTDGGEVFDSDKKGSLPSGDRAREPVSRRGPAEALPARRARPGDRVGRQRLPPV